MMSVQKQAKFFLSLKVKKPLKRLRNKNILCYFGIGSCLAVFDDATAKKAGKQVSFIPHKIQSY